jgi:hypothetical protein
MILHSGCEKLKRQGAALVRISDAGLQTAMLDCSGKGNNSCYL